MHTKYINLLWVTLNDSQSFQKIVETLTRIGIANTESKTLTQECYILHKQGRYAIAHYTELQNIDNDNLPVCADNIQRRNFITHMLVNWDMCKIDNISNSQFDNNIGYTITVIKYKDRNKWNLISPYNIGHKHD